MNGTTADRLEKLSWTAGSNASSSASQSISVLAARKEEIEEEVTNSTAAV
jgi:hypothetical protein